MRRRWLGILLAAAAVTLQPLGPCTRAGSCGPDDRVSLSEGVSTEAEGLGLPAEQLEALRLSLYPASVLRGMWDDLSASSTGALSAPRGPRRRPSPPQSRYSRRS